MSPELPKTDSGPLTVVAVKGSKDANPIGPVVIRTGRLVLDGASITSSHLAEQSQPYAAVDIEAATVTALNKAKMRLSTPDAAPRG